MHRIAFASLAALAVAAAMAPVASAHDPALPPLPTQFCGPQHLHHYGAATSVDTHVVASVYWRTTVELFDSCPLDGEADFGVGGAFLPASHHGSYDGATGLYTITACAEDIAFGGDVGLVVGYDSGGGNIVEVARGVGCVPAASSTLGAGGGWWVFLTDRASTTGQQSVASVPTFGHIYDL